MTTLFPTAPRAAVARVPAEGSAAAARRGTGVRRAAGRASRLVVLSFALLLVGGLGIFQVLQTSRVATLGYEIRALERDRAQLAAQVSQLEAAVARRSTLERVRAEAVGRLGMVSPSEGLRVTVDAPVPRVAPLPRRYTQATEPAPAAPRAWWERALGHVPGLD